VVGLKKEGQPMNEWNYLTTEFTLDELQSAVKLNELGQDGWELVHMERLVQQGPGEKINIQGQPKWLTVFKKLIYQEKEENI
jgi:hypothetical protein